MNISKVKTEQEPRIDDWVARLSQAGPIQDNALVELADLLSGRLTRAFKGESKVDSAFVADAVQDSLTSILVRFISLKARVNSRLGRRHWLCV